MPAILYRVALAGMLIFWAEPSGAQDVQRYLTRYFTGNAIQFGFGSGVSSNSPRIELLIHDCASGVFHSAGRSCRPNIIARGHQCTPLRDSGQWQIVTQRGQGGLQWVSNGGNSGGTVLVVRGDGVVVDPRGNPFNRVGRAQCQ